MISKLFVSLVLWLGVWYTVEGQLICRVCNRASFFEDCDTEAVCAPDELCYLDQVITEDARVVYEGGCRAKDVCDQADASWVGKRSKRDELVACSKCCDVDERCNELLCGLPYKYYDELHCNSCGKDMHIRYSEDCYKQEICQHNEMCYASTFTNEDDTLTHVSGCMRAGDCRKIAQAIFMVDELAQNPARGKRSAFCTVCCGDTTCNMYDCHIIKDRLLQLKKERRLNETTLTELAHPIPKGP